MEREKPQRGMGELRRHAEERLTQRAASAGPPGFADRERLIHELEVHQIELEMQNEELKRLKEESDALAGRYLDIYEFAPIGYLTLDPGGQILQINLTAARSIDLPRAELIGRRFVDLISPASRSVFRDFFQSAFRSDHAESCECELRLAGKPPLLVQLVGSASLDKAQCRLAMIDITERRKADEGLRRYQLLALHSRDIILFTEKETGRIVEANAAAAQAYGYSRQELCGLTIADIAIQEPWPPNLAASEKGEDPGILFESLHRRRDGSQFPVEVSLHEGGGGDRGMTISVIRDITLRKREEAALEERSRQLEAANQELESFSYSVSHDLQTPLRAIDGYARMILKKSGAQLDEETKVKFTVIRENIQKMGKLINDLLAFSRLGRKELSLKTVEVVSLVDEVWGELHALHADRKLTLCLEPLPPALGDRALLKEVFGNLLANAVKFTRIRPEAVITVSGCVEGDETVYSITDNGVGFDMAYAGKLFGVFQRLHTAEEYEGTGVGLAIVQRIIHRHGGRIWAESEEGKGAAFHFTLPRR